MRIWSRQANIGIGLLAAQAALILTAALGQSANPDANLTDTQKTEFFTTRVQPILKQSCLPCHSGAAPSGGLSLANRAGVLKGSENGQIVTLGKPDDSGFIHAVRYEGVKMPPQGNCRRRKSTL